MILVTGAGGYLGSALVERLLKDGREVRGLEKSLEGIEVLESLRAGTRGGSHLEIFRGDVTDSDDLEEALRGVSIAVHMAGLPTVRGCEENPGVAMEVNAFAVREILESRGGELDLLLYPSSAAVYSPRLTGTVDEGSLVSPRGIYGASKGMGEVYAENYRETNGFSTTVFRQSNVYGATPAGFGGGVIETFVEMALAGEDLTLHGSGEQRRDFIHVDDLVEAYVAAIDGVASGETLNVCSGETASVNEVAEAVSSRIEGTEVGHVEGREESGSTERLYELSNEKAKNVLDWRPSVDLEKGIEEMIRDMEEKLG